VSQRLPCIVPFCRGTRGIRKGETAFKPGEEWICSVHWRMVGRRTRRLNNRAWRRVDRTPMAREYWKLPPGSPARLEAIRFLHVAIWLWTRCKKQATERAAGI
jgi:hypothetical protein